MRSYAQVNARLKRSSTNGEVKKGDNTSKHLTGRIGNFASVAHDVRYLTGSQLSRQDEYYRASLSQHPLHSGIASHFKMGVVMCCVLPGTRILQPE